MQIRVAGCVWSTFAVCVALTGCGDSKTPKLSISAPPDGKAGIVERATQTASTSTGATENVPADARSQEPLAPTEINPGAITAKGHAREWWEAVFANGSKIGWMRTTMSDAAENGQRGIQIDIQNQLEVDREGQRTAISIATKSFETPAGEPISFHTEMFSGNSRTLMDGQVEDGKLNIKTVTQGKTTTEQLPWSPGTLGYSATEQSLASSPILPGQRRSLKALMPATNQVVTIELVANQYEPTALLDHTEDLLRIDSIITLPMRSPDDKPPILRSQLWTNREGQVMKTALAALRQETFRTSRELALDKSGPRTVDLVLDNTVHVSRPLPDPHATSSVRYRVQLANDDPARVFYSGRLQEVTPLDEHTAEIVVRRHFREQTEAEMTPNSTVDISKSRRPPSEEDRAANNLIQSDDPKVLEMAKSAAGEEQDAWKVALVLEAYVKKTIKLKNFSQAFATAAEVAREPEGDCTEHAVLLAALARARGIPARVAIGLVYQTSSQGFVYHMWNELWIGNQWVPMDATLGRGGIGAAHLKLTDSNLAGAQAYSSFLPVAQVIGQLKVEILDVE
jgi:hypothetical protein